MKQTEELSTVGAETHLDICVECPYCGYSQDRTSDLTDHLDEGVLSAESCEAEIRCESQKCNKTFIVNKITY